MAYITNTEKIVEGSSISINDNEKLIDLELKGNTTQDGTPTPSSPVSIETVTGLQEIEVCGKNLFDKDSGFRLGFINSNGGFTNQNYTACFNQYISCQPNTTYTISFSKEITNMTAPIYYDKTKTFLSRASASTYFTKKTITTPANCYYMIIQFNYDNITMTQEIIDSVNCQVELGASATSYEPYIGKTYEINLGKNLYKPISFSRSAGGINYVYGLDGSISCDGIATANSYSMLSTDAPNYMFQINAGTYTISGGLTNIRLQVIEYDNGSVSMIAETTSSKRFTVDKPTNIYIRVRIASGTTVDNVKVYPQLEKGSEATSYSPYKTPIELCKIDDYQDKIYKENGNWYIHKEIGKYIFDGSEEGWNVRQGSNPNLYTYYLRNNYVQNSIKESGVNKSNRFIENNTPGLLQVDGGFRITEYNLINRIFLCVNSNIANIIINFKTWLSTHNTTVYYILATPTDTIITDTTLIEQLNAIELYKNINNINVSSANLSGILKLDYYSTDNPYQDVIYSQEDVNKCKLYFNDVELEDTDEYLEKITFIKRVLPENGKKIFTLDNFIAEEVEMIIHDIDTNTIQDKVRIELGTLVNNTYEYVPMGIYNIQDTPTRNDNKITIKLRDNACLFDFNYNAKPLIDSLGGSATKIQILQDICSQANVNCNVNSFIGDSDLIGIYDNTVTARMYVAYIAEQAGCIAKIDRYGNLIFIPLNSLYTHRIPLSICSKYVKGTPFQIERVVYELGTIKFETSNDETLPTLYISSANPYISVQNDIDRIFEIVENFELDSVEIQKEIIGNPAIDGYDLIEIYDDEDIDKPILFKTLANNTLTYNGKFKSKYKTEIGLEERTENVSKNSNETFKKTVKNEIDLVNGTITQTVEEVSTLDDIINGTPTYTVTTDTTFQADKPYYKLVDNDYVELVEGTDYNDGDAISSVGYDVYDIVYVDSIIDTMNDTIQNQISKAMPIIQSTLLEQTSEKFTMWFEQTGVQQLLDDTNSLATANSSDIEIMKAYIDYGTVPIREPYAGSPYILLGKENSQTKLRILDNRIQFLSSGQETAYISNNTLYINESTVLTKQIIGNNNGKWITEVDSQGNLNTYWGG